MAREKKQNNNDTTTEKQRNPQAEERKKLKKLAHTNKILSKTPAKGFNPLTPSKPVIKHHGSDIIKKSQKKNRYLFSFPGLLAPISGGKIGELTNLATKNPILYLDFPQGRMKLCGTIVYPKNRYMAMQFSKGGRNVICDDCFDTMIVFSDAYWVGQKDENPDEVRLEFPPELYEKEQSTPDFQGGAGASVKQAKITKTVAPASIEEESLPELPIDDTEAKSPDRQGNMKNLEYTTPLRHSGRTVAKRFKLTDVSSGEDYDGWAAEPHDNAAKNVLNHGVPETAVEACDSEVLQQSTVQEPISLLSSEKKKSSRTSFGQATISTLFKKVEQKSTEDVVEIVPEKVSSKIAEPSSSKAKNKSVKMPLVPEASQRPKEKNTSQDRRAGVTNMKKKRKAEVVEVEDDDVEFSSVSEESDDSDDDWEA